MQSMRSSVDMSAETTQLPKILDWPYVEIAIANNEFKRLFGKEPGVLWIGIYLWKNLQEAAPNASNFVAFGSIPVYLDRSGILGSREFIFAW